MENRSVFNELDLPKIIMAILVKRLGGSVEIIQSDVDAVAYNCLEETWSDDGLISFKLLEREKSS